MTDDLSPASTKHDTLFWTLLVIAVVIGIQHAVSLWYVNDDCYVSFRYAKNLVRGMGLVYNAGERVEGYTNFLWTAIVAFGLKFGLDPVSFSTTLGIGFYAATLVLYGFLSRRFRQVENAVWLIPITSIALSLHHDFNAHATSGMETSMFSFLVSAGYAALLLGKSWKPLAGAGLLLVLAMMTRPDGIIFLVAAVLYIGLLRSKPVRTSAVFLLPSLLVFLPYWMIRYAYYGFFFPNTFYAKSVDLSYYSQGLRYAALYFKTYYVFVLLPILWVAFLWFRKSSLRSIRILLSRIRTAREHCSVIHPIALYFFAVILYTLFTIRIGGDFMFARFFIAVTPMMYFSIELLLNALTRRSVTMICYGIVILATLFRFNQYGSELTLGYVTDESRYFTREGLQQAETNGTMLRTYFNGLPVRIAFWASLLKLVYYMDPPYALESSGGLTDTVVAHEAITERGQPGHEKVPTTDYLISRRVNFYFGPLNPIPPGGEVLNAIMFNHILARIIVYNDTIMSAFSRYPEIRFIRMPDYLDAYIAGIDTIPGARLAHDYGFFKSYYFDENRTPRDSLRESVILAHLRKE
ncbi:MAG TPA: hypothetical protein VLY03_08215 [Bacteroidota bacterium]|nr:hypothetical protein [Bacteroidota bacterium]